MMASAIQGYVNRYAVLPGRRAVLFTNNNSAYAVAADLMAAGVTVAAIIDSRKSVPEPMLRHAAGTEVLAGHVITSARGHKRVRAVSVSLVEGGSNRVIPCDLLGHSGGWNPAVHLFSQSRGSLRYDADLASFVPDQPAQPTLSASAAAGHMTLTEALQTGSNAGTRAAISAGFTATPAHLPESNDSAYAIEPLWRVQTPGPGGKAFLDIQNDVTVDDVHLALREGYSNVEHVKRYTTGGMGIDQGKTGNINIIGAIALQQGVDIQAVGTTTFRSPYTPVSFGSMARLRERSVGLERGQQPLGRTGAAGGWPRAPRTNRPRATDRQCDPGNGNIAGVLRPRRPADEVLRLWHILSPLTCYQGAHLGADAARIMSIICPLAPHPSVFADTRLTFCEVLGLKALVSRTLEGFEIAVDQSFGDFVADCLEHASA